MTQAKSFRYKLIVEYDGTPYVGWQIQKNGLSVQEALQKAITGFCGEPVIPFGAGRTDAGVHATGQTAHIDLPSEFSTRTVRNAINQHLKPAPISVQQVEVVSSEFDARFSAIKRHYRYHIINRRPPLTFQKNRAWLVHGDLNVEPMQEASQLLIGKHDFTAFRSINCQAKSPIKTLDKIDVERQGQNVFVTVSARSFMHNQVRSIVGSLKMVGEGKWPISQIGDVLESRKRTQCGPVAPAHGLYFTKVEYPE